MSILGKAKPFHLCSVGSNYCGEINQCQKPGVVWVEVRIESFGTRIAIALCADHYSKYLKDNDDYDDEEA